MKRVILFLLLCSAALAAEVAQTNAVDFAPARAAKIGTNSILIEFAAF